MTRNKKVVWRDLVDDCRAGTFSSINVASKKRRAVILAMDEELDMAKHIIGEFVWPPDATPEQRRCFIQTSARFSGCVIPQYSENDERGEGEI